MSRMLKDLVVNELKTELNDVNTAVVLSFSGVNNEDNTKLRADLRAQKVRLRMVSNKLAKLSVQGLPLEPLTEHLSGSSVIAFPDPEADSATVPKAVCPWEKKTKGIDLKGGVFEGRLITSEEIIRLSKLPSREELLAQILGAVQSPLVGIAGLLTSPLQEIIGLLDALHEKKSEAS